MTTSMEEAEINAKHSLSFEDILRLTTIDNKTDLTVCFDDEQKGYREITIVLL